MAERTVEFAGETFRTADSIGAMALMRFAKVAKDGTDSSEMAGLAAMYDLLQQCISEQDWPRFEAAADRSRADGEALMAVVQEVVTLLSERPTQPRSDAPAGPRSTSTTSTAGSSSRATAADRIASRPDLQVIAQQAQRSA